jgi:ABC-2 type transport system permease protein
MRKAWMIALLRMRQTFQSKATLIMSFAMPLLMTVIFGVALGGGGGGESSGRTYPIAIVDADATFASRQLVAALSGEQELRVQVVTADRLPRLFTDRQIDAGLIIPAGFQQGIRDGKPPELVMQSAPGGSTNVTAGPAVQREAARVAGDYLLARQIAGTATDEVRVAEAYSRVASERKSLGITAVQESARKTESTAPAKGAQLGQSALGFTVMFVMMLVFMGGGAILQERQIGTWGRLLTTPTPKLAILGGLILSFFITGLAQFGVLWGLTAVLFRANWGPPLPLLAVASALILCGGAMGLCLAGFVRTQEQQAAIGVALVISTSMLGGVYWPLDFVSPLMRRIAYLTPQAWAMDGFREVMLRGGAWGALLWPLVVLLSLAVIFTTAGLLRVRYE